MEESTDKKKEVSAKRVVYTTLLIDFGDIILMGAISIITGSIVTLAQVFQAISNVLTDTFLLMGLKNSKRPADNNHPFGYSRSIYVWTLFAAVLMFAVVSGLSIYFGYQRIINPEAITNINLAYGIIIFSIMTNAYGVNLSLRRLRLSLGKHKHKGLRQIWRSYNDSPYVETKAAFITDLVGSMGAWIGLIALVLYQATGNLWFDGLGAILIGLTQGFFSLMLLFNLKDLLIGKGVSPRIREKIEHAARSTDGIEHILAVEAENIGLQKIFVVLHVHMSKDMNTQQVEETIQLVKYNIRLAVPMVAEIAVEPDADPV